MIKQQMVLTNHSDSRSYTTSNTPMFSLTPTWNFSFTGNAYAAISLSPTLVPIGASAGNGQGVTVGTTIGTSAVNMGGTRGFNASITVSAGYTGTINELNGGVFSIANGGTNPAGTAKTVNASQPNNGNGITSGTVNNYTYSGTPQGTPPAAASGGTVNNAVYYAALSSGSGAGTTSNVGLQITGSGGSGGGGTTNNYAIYSDSAAPSRLAGALTAAAVAVPAGGSTGIGLMMSTTANLGMFFGSGTPSLSAAKGSLYLRTDGTTTNDRAYINTNGTTGWTPLTTGA